MPTKLSPVTRILNLVKLERKEITAVYFYAILSGLIQLSLHSAYRPLLVLYWEHP